MNAHKKGKLDSLPRMQWWLRLIVAIVGLFIVSSCNLGSGSAARELVRTLPVYPGANFLAEFRTTWPDDTPSRGITYETEDPADQVFEFYHTVMPEADWHLVYVREHPQEGVSWQLRYERDGWWSRIVIEELSPTRICLQVGRM